MFRKKENEHVRATGLAEKQAEPLVRPADLSRSQPDLSRRSAEIPVINQQVISASGGRSAEKVTGEGKRLIVGPGISLSGEITACDRLVVQGSVQVTLNETRAIEITDSGRFTNGRAEVEEAEISGVYEGELTVRHRLLIRSTGQVKGTVRYGELEIERGGKLTGSVSMIEGSGGANGHAGATMGSVGNGVVEAS